MMEIIEQIKMKKSEFKNYKGNTKLKFLKGRDVQFKLQRDFAYHAYIDSTQKSAIGFNRKFLRRRTTDEDGKMVLRSAISYKEFLEFPVGDIILDPTIETSFEAVEDV
ncbi:MAG: hypothetical protein GF313_11515 [Caldithrix sp.]|nr:hypothetical protein [Caldithrix sp.]